MENRLQNKISVDVAADARSLDSLSFAGLVCIQDQQWKSASTDTANQIQKEDSEFEFSQSRPTFKTATAPTNDFPSNLLISDGQLLSQTSLSQSKQHYAINQQHYRGSVPATRNISKRSSCKTGVDTEVSDRQYQEQRNQVKKEQTASKSCFGQKVFESFLSPCRECQAADSTVKAHKLRGENVKLH